jgi:antitoxin YefM
LEVHVSKQPRLSRDIQPLSAFRANTARFVRHVQETGRPLVLTQHDRGAAVLLDVQQYERLVERAELAEDIRAAEAQLARDEGVPHAAAREQVRKRIRA